MDMNKTEIVKNCLNPTCPCQDGDPCHYVTYKDSPAMTIPCAYMIPGHQYEKPGRQFADGYEQNRDR